MKIVNIILEGRIGGPQLRITEVGRELQETFGIETVAVFPCFDSELFQCLLKMYGLKYHAVPLHKLSKSLVKLLKWGCFFIPEVLRLKRIIDAENPDIVHCGGSWQWKGVVAAKLAKKRILWHLNDTHMPFPVRLVFRSLMGFADGFIVEGARVKEYYLGNGDIACPFKEIQSAVDSRVFHPGNTEPDEGLMKFVGSKILTVGNVNPSKGIEYLIEAAVILSSKFEALHFFEVGNMFKSQTRYINKVKQMVQARHLTGFHFCGYSDNIRSLLKAADIYVCSSISEASPTAVWEAMAMGKAIVATDVGSVADFIKDGESGFVVPIKNGPALAEKIELFLKYPELRRKCGENARAIAETQLDLKIAARKHKEIYEEISLTRG